VNVLVVARYFSRTVDAQSNSPEFYAFLSILS